jgi:hypothetical protein
MIQVQEGQWTNLGADLVCFLSFNYGTIQGLTFDFPNQSQSDPSWN